MYKFLQSIIDSYKDSYKSGMRKTTTTKTSKFK